MEKEFAIENNKWLANLFGLKHVSARAYVKHVWSAGIRTTQLIESFNAYLKQYLARQYALPEFFKHFEMLLFYKRYKEYAAKYDLLHKMPRLKARSPILDQLMVACMSENVRKCNNLGNGVFSYEVTVYNDNFHKLVARTHDDLLSCSYGKFEMEGIKCSHTLKVLKDVMYANEIPSHYILKRWTRNGKDGRVEDILGSDVITNPRLEIRRQHRILCRYLSEISAIASVSEKEFNNVLVQVKSLKKITQGAQPNPRPACNQTARANAMGNSFTNIKLNIHAQTIEGLTPKGIATKHTLKGRRYRLIPALERATAKKRKAIVPSRSRTTTTPTYILNNGAEVPVEFFCSDECYMPTCSTQGHEWDNYLATYFG
ncbi:protein FAR-RED IMPAIRED RESPONSE 1-like [Cornus florida]|uniref:protein FAR-RED IMPAIRED RESPONSE 1-like n=1 Tax=Cornus florida TaxID=4283 RepID=UPI00289DAEB6|nr:protein FAR-RED IMPAIRED RESPONSE 1-like [Cornus florida]